MKRAEDLDGYMSTQELDALRLHAAQARTVVEIGSWAGRSSHALAETCPGVVHCIDWFRGTPNDPEQEPRVRCAALNGEGEKAYAAFLENLAEFLQAGKVRLYPLESVVVASFLGPEIAPIDLLFLDGSHDRASVVADLKAWLPFLGPGGVLLLHDRDYPSVQQAVADMHLTDLEPLAGSLWKWSLHSDQGVPPC